MVANNIHSFGVLANSTEKPGAFQQRKYKKAETPKKEHQATESEKEISPAHVARTVPIGSRGAGEG